jgi:hypothetical protein
MQGIQPSQASQTPISLQQHHSLNMEPTSTETLIPIEHVWTCLSGQQQHLMWEMLVNICRMLVTQTTEQTRQEDDDAAQ